MSPVAGSTFIDVASIRVADARRAGSRSNGGGSSPRHTKRSSHQSRPQPAGSQPAAVICSSRPTTASRNSGDGGSGSAMISHLKVSELQTVVVPRRPGLRATTVKRELTYPARQRISHRHAPAVSGGQSGCGSKSLRRGGAGAGSLAGSATGAQAKRFEYHASPGGSGVHPALRTAASMRTTDLRSRCTATASGGGHSTGSDEAMRTSGPPPSGRAVTQNRGPSPSPRHSSSAVHGCAGSGGRRSCAPRSASSGPSRPLPPPSPATVNSRFWRGRSDSAAVVAAAASRGIARVARAPCGRGAHGRRRTTKPAPSAASAAEATNTNGVPSSSGAGERALAGRADPSATG